MTFAIILFIVSCTVVNGTFFFAWRNNTIINAFIKLLFFILTASGAYLAYFLYDLWILGSVG